MTSTIRELALDHEVRRSRCRHQATSETCARLHRERDDALRRVAELEEAIREHRKEWEDKSTPKLSPAPEDAQLWRHIGRPSS